MWVAINITSPEYGDIYKLLLGWYGSYATGDSWKINSGIVKVEDAGDYWKVFGESGSVYTCYKEAERFSRYTQMIFDNFSDDITKMGDGYSIVQVDAAESFKQFMEN